MKLSKQIPQYESEISQFIRQLKENNPSLEEKQRQGRALLWDKEPINLDQQKRDRNSRVPQAGYVYQSRNKQK